MSLHVEAHTQTSKNRNKNIQSQENTSLKISSKYIMFVCVQAATLYPYIQSISSFHAYI